MWSQSPCWQIWTRNLLSFSRGEKVSKCGCLAPGKAKRKSKKRKKEFYMTEFLVLSMIFVLQITLYPKQLCARYCLQDTTTKMSYGRESPRREFTPVVVLGREFHSGTKYSNGIMRNVCDFESYMYFINMKGRVLGTPHGQTRELL